ncbi:MAG: RluA family pseudouridine synthase [Defluviitaleaceae bacterium]|nr:RluA family pseudouridine synthase [Defluviitaleaceae bacterium]MCL2261897.1 RluA family pseudouridine synthase [Defluviitaleaceae bacterium]
MKIIELIVPPEADGKRIDTFLAEYCEEISSRSAAQKMLSDNRVQILGVKGTMSPCGGIGGETPKVLKNSIVQENLLITVEIPAPVPLEAMAEEIPLNIIYEDSDLLVVDKPRGLVVHPAAGHHSGTLVNALLHHCSLSEIGGELRPGIVHRLDKDTSGLMVVAKNDTAHIALAAQLEKRTMGRTYNAVCLGNVKKNLRIDLPIGRHPRDRKKMAVIPPHTLEKTRARNAVTNIEILEKFKGFTLIAARLETGRTHQIRVHMAHIGNPVLGDTVYGTARQPFGLEGQILHAVGLRFSHPSSGAEMEFTSPLPDYFQKAILAIGGN